MAAAATPIISLNSVEPGFFETKPEEAQAGSQHAAELRVPREPTQGQNSKPTSLPIQVEVFDRPLSARSDTILLGAVSDRRLRLRKAIPLAVSVEEGHVIVAWEGTNEFAYGASTGDAIEEFSKLIGELYFDLNDQSIPLGKDLAKVRDILNEHIEKVR